MEKIKKLNIKIKIAMGCVIVLLILVLGSFAKMIFAFAAFDSVML